MLVQDTTQQDSGALYCHLTLAHHYMRTHSHARSHAYGYRAYNETKAVNRHQQSNQSAHTYTYAYAYTHTHTHTHTQGHFCCFIISKFYFTLL